MLPPVVANRDGKVTWVQPIPEHGPVALATYLDRPIASVAARPNPMGQPTLEVFRHHPNGTQTVLATTTGLSLQEETTDSDRWVPADPILVDSYAPPLFWTWILAGSGTALLATGGILHGVHNDFVDGVSGSPTGSEVDRAYGYRASSIAMYASGATALAASILFYFIEGEEGETMLGSSPSGYPGFSVSW